MTVLATPGSAAGGSSNHNQPVRLAVTKATAAQHIRAHVQHGMSIRRQRIRYIEDLEDVRALKTEWVNSYTATLGQLFTGSDIADECNDWVGKVYPEFAEVSLFVEQFYEEMDYRIQKLKNVLKRLEDMGEYIPRTVTPPPAPSQEGYASTPVPAPAPAPAPPPPAPQVMQTPVQMPSIVVQFQSAPASAPAAAPAPSPAPAAPAPRPAPAVPPVPQSSSQSASQSAPAVPNLPPPPTEDSAPPLNMGIFVVHGDLSAASNTVTAFVEDLGIQLKPLPVAPQGGKGLVNSLEKNPDASFALMLLGQEDAVALRRSAADASAGVRSGIIFQLGYFVGRLGLKRVCVLYTGGADTFVSDHGVQFIPMDTGNGWQLLLARHLKRAGIEIDLNKLF